MYVYEYLVCLHECGTQDMSMNMYYAQVSLIVMFMYVCMVNNLSGWFPTQHFRVNKNMVSKKIVIVTVQGVVSSCVYIEHVY